MATKKKTSVLKSKSKVSTSKSKPKKTVKGKVIDKKYENLHLDESFKNVFLIISIFFLVVGVVRLFSGINVISGLQYMITAVLFSKAYRKLSEKKISVSSKNPRDKTFFIIGFIFLIVGISINLGVWAMGLVLFSIWLFSKK